MLVDLEQERDEGAAKLKLLVGRQPTDPHEHRALALRERMGFVGLGRGEHGERAVTVPGGDLTVEWKHDNHVILTGPAELEFSGSLDPQTGRWSRDRLVA